MDWFLFGKALLIVIGSTVGFVGFVAVIEKYPNVGALVLIVGLILIFTALVYRMLGG